MKRLHKFLLFIISLTGIGVSVGMLSVFYPVPLISDMIKERQIHYPWVGNIFAISCLFVCFCFFLLLIPVLTLPNKSDDLVLARDKGKIFFSRQTLESAILYSFKDSDAIVSSKVKVKINRQPEKTRIYIKLSVNDLSKLLDLTEEVQNKIESSLKSSFGIIVNSIAVSVSEFNRDSNSLKEEGADIVKESRVV